MKAITSKPTRKGNVGILYDSDKAGIPNPPTTNKTGWYHKNYDHYMICISMYTYACMPLTSKYNLTEYSTPFNTCT